jgi:hypothetical protein
MKIWAVQLQIAGHLFLVGDPANESEAAVDALAKQLLDLRTGIAGVLRLRPHGAGPDQSDSAGPGNDWRQILPEAIQGAEAVTVDPPALFWDWEIAIRPE